MVLGPRQEALRDQFPVDDQLRVLLKPIKMKQIQETVQNLAPPIKK